MRPNLTLNISGNTNEAEKNYDNALKLPSVFNYSGNSEIRKIIEKERSGQPVREPIVIISELK